MSFANRLPQLLSNFDIVVVRKGVDQSHGDFHVRSVVHRALQWLIMNNFYYRANHEADLKIQSYTVSVPVAL